jgi:sugar phosphate isomerase/epimerase
MMREGTFSMPVLSLDSLTLTDTPPDTLIRSAHRAGFDLVSLWALPPSLYPRQLLTPDRERACAAALADTGIGVHSLEVFDLTSPEAARAAAPALEIGARLGAKTVVAIHFSNPDRMQVAEALATLAEQAAQAGLAVMVEPVAMGLTRTLAEADALIRDAGIEAGLLFDSYHFVRVGGCPSDLAAIDPARIRYVQICDGPAGTPEADWVMESVQERLYPGDGDLPLLEMLRHLPRDVPWAIEAPSLRRAAAGVTPAAQAEEAYAALARLLAGLDDL